MESVRSITSESSSGAAARRDPREWAALLVPLLILAALIAKFWFVTDDAFISFRYAKNLVEGHGLVYNVGESPPVEGFSNFLWVLAVAAMLRAGVDILLAAPFLSALCAVALVAHLYVALRRRFDAPIVAATGAALLPATAMPFVVWSTGGLETMPYALFLFIAFERMLLRDDRIAPLTAGAAALVAALLRVDGVAWTVVIAVLSLVLRPTTLRQAARACAKYMLILFVGYGSFLLWRHAYFGDWIPNTAHAKSVAGPEFLMRGVRYVASQGLTNLSLILALLLAPLALFSRRRAPAFAAVAMVCGILTAAALTSGDFMPFGRFIVPAIPFLGLLFGIALATLCRKRALGTAAAGLIAIAAATLGVLPGWDVHPVPESLRARCDFRNRREYWSELTQWQMHVAHAYDWTAMGLALRQISGSGDSIVMPNIGAVGYYSDLHMFDRCGLVTPAVALRPLGQKIVEQPGHDRLVPPTFFLERGDRPTFARALIRRVIASDSEMVELAQRQTNSFRERVGVAYPYVPEYRAVVVDSAEAPQPRYLLALFMHQPATTDVEADWRKANIQLASRTASGTVPTIHVALPRYLRAPVGDRATTLSADGGGAQ